MKTNEPTTKKNLTVALPADLMDRFTSQCAERGYEKQHLMESLLPYWMRLDESLQQDIYHRRTSRDTTFKRDVSNVLRQLGLLEEETLNGSGAKGKQHAPGS